MTTSVRLKRLSDVTEPEAELFNDVTVDDFQQSHDLWRPTLVAAAKALKLKGEPIPLYLHWDWRKGAALSRLDVSFFGLRCDGHIQGLMKADLAGTNRCRLESQKGQELVYVDYVETAPWNIPKYMQVLGFEAVFSRVGTRLMQAAVQLSIDNEFKGRVGLHSLKESEDFYRGIGMTEVGRDVAKQNLLWFEFTPEAAQTFLEK